MKDEALKLALEALEGIHPGNMTPMAEEYWNKAITAIKQALAAQPAVPEAIVDDSESPQYRAGWNECRETMLYMLEEHPAAHQWVGLTDDEMVEAMGYWSEDCRSAYGGATEANGEYVDMISTWRYIEAKLKEKNT
jgi:hypothetical protein